MLEKQYLGLKEELRMLLNSGLSSARRWILIEEIETELFEVERQLLVERGYPL